MFTTHRQPWRTHVPSVQKIKKQWTLPTFCTFFTTSDHNVDPHLVVISSLPFSDDCFLLISTMWIRRSPFPSLRCLSLFDFDLWIEISMCPLGGPATLAFCCIFPFAQWFCLNFVNSWTNGIMGCVCFSGQHFAQNTLKEISGDAMGGGASVAPNSSEVRRVDTPRNLNLDTVEWRRYPEY